MAIMKNLEITERKDVVVIFEKEVIDDTTVYIPMDLRIGYLDVENKVFVSKEDTFKYLLSDDQEICFGLRMPLQHLKEISQKEGSSLKETAYNYLCTISDFEYFFNISKTNNSLSVGFSAREIETGEVKAINEPDMELGLKYLLEKIFGDDFDENMLVEYNSEMDLDILNDFDDDDMNTDEMVEFVFDAKKLSEEIKTNVIGQDDAIDDIVTIIWQNQRADNKSNILLIGPSGVGKTEIIRNLSAKLDIPMAKINITDTSQSAYVGTSISDSVRQLIINANYDIEKASRGIIFIDEIDKKAGYGYSGSSNVMTAGVQDELLKLLEDNDYEIDLSDNPFDSNVVVLNTKNITFICAGAFSNIKEFKNESVSKGVGFFSSVEEKVIDSHITRDDLLKYGFKNELVGRLHNIIELSSLSKEDLIKIMKSPNNKSIQDKINILKSLGIEVNINEEVYELLADRAIKSNTGARGLVSEVDNLFMKAMKDISYGPDDFQELILNTETVANNGTYKLVKRKSS